jgi:hypothetical protein
MKKLIFFINCAVAIVMAGQNSSSKLFFDTDISSPQIDSVRYCLKDSLFTLGINIADASVLYSYQVFLQYDTSRLQFVSAAKGNDVRGNFLESNGGSLSSFLGIRSKDDSTRILIAGTLQGNDKSQCVSGSGSIALVVFKMKMTDSTKLTFVKPIALDYDLVEDTTLQRYSATIISGSSKVVFKRNPKSNLQKINLVSGKVHITFPDVSRSEITLVNIKGRVITKRTELSKQLSLDLTDTGVGLFILKITQNGVMCACPLILR